MQTHYRFGVNYRQILAMFTEYLFIHYKIEQVVASGYTTIEYLNLLLLINEVSGI